MTIEPNAVRTDAGLGSGASVTCTSAREPWSRVLLAPLIGIAWPRHATLRVVGASSAMFWTVFTAAVLLIWAIVLSLMTWNATVEIDVIPVTTTVPATLLGGTTFALRERSFGEVWQHWGQQPFHPAALSLLLVALITALGTAVLAWLQLPVVHRSGAPGHSYARAIRAVASCAGMLALLVLMVGAVLVAVNNSEERRVASGNWTAEFDVHQLAPVLLPAAACLLVFWTGRAARGARAPSLDVALPLRCEGCGYDLTHVPADERCPECGLSTESSLRRDGRRRCCEWERRPSLKTWLSTSWSAMRYPREFYGALKLRTPDEAALTFGRRHFVCIGIAAAACTLGNFAAGSVTFSPRYIPFIVSALMGFGIPLVGWLAHRTVAAIAATHWLLQGALPDFGWAAKAIAYETAFLWVPALYVGALATSFNLFDSWFSKLSRVVFPNARVRDAEPVTLLIGLGAIGVIWLLRYRTILQRIRWSNY